jgi:hypothetical protein
MSPIEEEIIRKKIAVLIENLKSLEPIMNMTPKEYIEE